MIIRGAVMDKETGSTKIRFKKAVLNSKSLKDEVLVAFGLIFLTLLVLVGYLFPGIASVFEIKSTLSLIFGIISIILIIGLMVIVQIVEPVIKLSREAKLIAQGDLTREIQLLREDELGDLGASVDTMRCRIRDNVEKLKRLSQTTEVLKEEINSRIATLSNLMTISMQMAQNASLDDVLEVVIKKCFETYEMTSGCVILKDSTTHEFKIRYMSDLRNTSLMSRGMKDMKIQVGEGLLGRTILNQETVIVDRNTSSSKDVEDFKDRFLIKNAVIVPISSKGDARGLFIVGHEKDGFTFPEMEKELLELMAQNIAVAVLNDLLGQRETNDETV